MWKNTKGNAQSKVFWGQEKAYIKIYIYIYESKRFVTAKYQIKFLFHSQIKVIITWTSSAFRLARERGQLSNIQASLSNRHYVNEVKLTQNVNSSHYHQQQKKKKKCCHFHIQRHGTGCHPSLSFSLPARAANV